MSRELRCEAEGLLWRDVRRQLLRELLELYHLHWAPEALQRGGGAEAADNDASPPPATQSEVLGAALGQLVLLVRLAARHLSLAPLPFDTEFRGSDSLIWHRGQHREPRRVRKCYRNGPQGLHESRRLRGEP